MNTSDPANGLSLAPSNINPIDIVNAGGEGLLDIGALTRLANQFFRAAPAESQSLGVVLPGVGPSAAQAVPSLSETELRGLIQSPATHSQRGVAPAQVSSIPVPSTPSPPSIPTTLGAIPNADSLTSPGYSFLSEARSILAAVPALPLNAVPLESSASLAAPLAPDTRVNPVPISLDSITPRVLTGAPVASTPQIAGASTRPADVEKFTSFDFLQSINPLEPFNGVPTLAPVVSQISSGAPSSTSSAPFDVNAVRRDFPILQEKINGRPLIWLDNAATTQKPQSVIDRISYFYEHENSNIHRAAHTLAARSTDAYEDARQTVARFLNASSSREIIFVRGATEGINLVAQSWGQRNIQKDDEIIITWLEHHANIVPWQMLCAQKGARLRIAPVDDSGQILLDEYQKLFNPRTRLASLAHVSNALGTVTPVLEMTDIAHRHGAKVLIDGAQAVSHLQVDVQAIDCDFYVFSGHKLFGPTGIGIVYGKSQVLDATPPWQGGGNMIADVTFEKTLYQPPPFRFEAGTGNIADAIGLGAAIQYIERIGMANISRYEHDLLDYATDALRRIPGLRLIGTARDKASVLSFVLDGFRTEEIGSALNLEGIAVRSGHHCAQPILRRFGVESSVRPSLAFYNTCEEIDALVNAIWNIKNGRSPGVA